MIRIAITEAAFEAIAATLPLGSVSFERQADAKGERVWFGSSGPWSISSTPPRPR
jgi:hypothetical protein